MAANKRSKISWFTEHAPELYRGVFLGLILGIIFCVVAWEPAPAPAIGSTEDSVIAAYGPPDSVNERIGHKLPEGIAPAKYLVYRNGLFNLSITLIMINPNTHRVMNVTHDNDTGY